MDLFRFIQDNFLVYNISWEDVRIDRKLLQLNEHSDICMITGGGCNALTYLLDTPHSIHTADINYRQNALLELKTALIRHGEHNDLIRLFRFGKHDNYLQIYKRVRSHLSPFSRNYWDSAITFFDPLSEGFYFRGTCGRFAMALNSFLSLFGVREDLLRLTREAMSVSDRKEIYTKVDQKVFGNMLSGIWKTSPILSLLGVPLTQSSRTNELHSFLRSRLYEIFVKQDPTLNPYWGLYLNGSYTEANPPDYLNTDHSDRLRQQIPSLHIHNGSLIDMIRSSAKVFSHFVLLDHMDWYDRHDPLLIESWDTILEHSRPGTRILLRSVENDPSCFPDVVHRSCDIHLIPTGLPDLPDRVNTYAGTWLLEVL